MEYKEIHGFLVFEDGRVFKPALKPGKGDKSDYLIASYGGERYPIHRLIAEAFIQNPENKPYVNHIDGNSHNNAASNLEWVTVSENVAHAWATGLIPRRNLSKLKREAWKESQKGRCNPLRRIRKERHVTQKDLASQLGIARSTVAMWETGRAIPSMDTIARISDILDCQVKDLLTSRA